MTKGWRESPVAASRVSTGAVRRSSSARSARAAAWVRACSHILGAHPAVAVAVGVESGHAPRVLLPDPQQGPLQTVALGRTPQRGLEAAQAVEGVAVVDPFLGVTVLVARLVPAGGGAALRVPARARPGVSCTRTHQGPGGIDDALSAAVVEPEGLVRDTLLDRAPLLPPPAAAPFDPVAVPETGPPGERPLNGAQVGTGESGQFDIALGCRVDAGRRGVGDSAQPPEGLSPLVEQDRRAECHGPEQEPELGRVQADRQGPEPVRCHRCRDLPCFRRAACAPQANRALRSRSARSRANSSRSQARAPMRRATSTSGNCSIRTLFRLTLSL